MLFYPILKMKIDFGMDDGIVFFKFFRVLKNQCRYFFSVDFTIFQYIISKKGNNLSNYIGSIEYFFASVSAI